MSPKARSAAAGAKRGKDRASTGSSSEAAGLNAGEAATATDTPKAGKKAKAKGSASADDGGGSGSKGKGSGKGKPGPRGPRAQVHTFPPAEPIEKGDRVEVVVDGVAREGVLLSIGNRDKKTQARVAWAAPGKEPPEGGEKEWRCIKSEVRPTPPEPPEKWRRALRPDDLLAYETKEGWVEVAYGKLVLPPTETSPIMVEVTIEATRATKTVAEAKLRPIWAFNHETSTWAIVEK